MTKDRGSRRRSGRLRVRWAQKGHGRALETGSCSARDIGSCGHFRAPFQRCPVDTRGRWTEGQERKEEEEGEEEKAGHPDEGRPTQVPIQLSIHQQPPWKDTPVRTEREQERRASQALSLQTPPMCFHVHSLDMRHIQISR